MQKHAVVIAGCGPTGMMLAAELALAGIDVAIVERREDQTLVGSRAGGLHTRTIEILDQRGILGRFLAEGQILQRVAFAGSRLDLSDFPTRHPYVLGLWQNHIERLLACWLEELLVPIYRGKDVLGFMQGEHTVTINLSENMTLQAEYLVGCDGARSVVRKSAGIDFVGWDATVSCLIGEVEMTEQPKFGIHYDSIGIHSFGRMQYEIRHGEIIFKDSGPVSFLVTEKNLVLDKNPTLREVSDALVDAWGTDYGAHNPTWISRFTDVTRQAASYRKGRILLAGDAAHIQAPDGGQGLNIGVQDAVNLGWKLAQVVKGQSPESLLDTYAEERKPVVYRALRKSMAAVSLRRGGEAAKALRETMAELLGMDEPRKKIAGLLSGLDVHYELTEGNPFKENACFVTHNNPIEPAGRDQDSAKHVHSAGSDQDSAKHDHSANGHPASKDPSQDGIHPLVGRRMPDLDLITKDGPIKFFQFLHKAQPVLLNLGDPRSISIGPWAKRIHLLDAAYGGKWELPVIGEVSAPKAVLVRPDGYVAWVGDEKAIGLKELLAFWFGSGS